MILIHKWVGLIALTIVMMLVAIIVTVADDNTVTLPEPKDQPVRSYVTHAGDWRYETNLHVKR